jgi:hypothetical protein
MREKNISGKKYIIFIILGKNYEIDFAIFPLIKLTIAI